MIPTNFPCIHNRPPCRGGAGGTGGQTGSFPSLKISNHFEPNESCQTNIRKRSVCPRFPSPISCPRFPVSKAINSDFGFKENSGRHTSACRSRLSNAVLPARGLTNQGWTGARLPEPESLMLHVG